MFEYMRRMAADSRAKRHSPYFPISAYEAPGLEAIFSRIIFYCTCLSIILNYSAALFAKEIESFYYMEEVYKVMKSVAAVNERFGELQSYDGQSGSQYLAILLISIIVGIIAGGAKIVAYIRMVIIPGREISSDARATLGFLHVTIISCVALWGIFFQDIHIAGVRYIGMKRILVWPIFPIFAGMSTILVSSFLAMLVGAMTKIAVKMWRKNNG